MLKPGVETAADVVTSKGCVNRTGKGYSDSGVDVMSELPEHGGCSHNDEQLSAQEHGRAMVQCICHEWVGFFSCTHLEPRYCGDGVEEIQREQNHQGA